MLRELAHTAVAAANSENNLLLQACKWFKKNFPVTVHFTDQLRNV